MRFLFSIAFLFCCCVLHSEKKEIVITNTTPLILKGRTIGFSYGTLNSDGPNPLLKFLKKKQKRTRKLTAALLAFPFPFGIVGLHRIYLGTEPYVPVAYIASLGGIFGVLPLIDFFVILFDKDFDQYNNNGKVLMWVK
jgi:TM2 domain-containing membrane protein YozV